jgi:hypothetical protein
MINDKDVEDGNVPMTITSIPGFVHARCKAEFDISIISDSNDIVNLDKDVKKLIGE